MGVVEKQIASAFRDVAKRLGLKAENRTKQAAVAKVEAAFKRDGVAFTRQAYQDAVAKGGFVQSTGMPSKAAIESFLKRAEGDAMTKQSLSAIEIARTLHIDNRSGAIVEQPLRMRLPKQGRPQPKPQHLASSVDQAQFDSAMKGLNVQARPKGAALPEDGSLRPTVLNMFHDGGDPVSTSYVAQMSEVGQAEGFHVVVATKGEGSSKHLLDDLTPRQRKNVSIVEQPGEGNVWIEDFMTTTDRREVIVAPDVKGTSGRTPFQGPGIRHQEEGIPHGVIAAQGQVDASGVREGAVGLGVAGKRRVIQARTYVEDGNFIPGTLADGTAYGIVGKDSVRISRDHLRITMKKPNLTDKETLKIMAEDFGLKPKNLFAVEQPAEFHLDMRMLAVGPKEIVLNDSMAAAELQAKWWIDDFQRSQPRHPLEGATKAQLETYNKAMLTWKEEAQYLDQAITGLKQKAEVSAKVEARTAADLEKHGFKVHRVAGEFHQSHLSADVVSSPHRGMMNFFNGEQGINAEGKKFFTSMGGDPRAEKYFFGRVATETSAGYSHVNLLQRKDTDATLQLMGGLNCRVKPDGYRIPPENLMFTDDMRRVLKNVRDRKRAKSIVVT